MPATKKIRKCSSLPGGTGMTAGWHNSAATTATATSTRRSRISIAASAYKNSACRNQKWSGASASTVGRLSRRAPVCTCPAKTVAMARYTVDQRSHGHSMKVSLSAT